MGARTLRLSGRQRLLLLLGVLGALVASCGTDSTSSDDEPTASTTTTSTSTTSTTTATTTTSTTASTATGSTATTSTATTTTATTGTLPPPDLFIEGTPMVRFAVEVGDGVDLDRDELARFVVETLSDERSWIGRGAGFELVDDGGLFTIIVAKPERVDQLCAPLQTNGRFSCARNGWIAFNSLRWFDATDDWPADIETYRRYLVNHEVGHYIVGPTHAACPADGGPAPIMMQQTKGLDGCDANGWVNP